jgi:hypothetical protein
MLAKKIIKLRNSEGIKRIGELSAEAEALLKKNEDDYTECIEMFPKIFRRLASRKKVLDIPILKGDGRKIILHQFGLFLSYEYFSLRKRSKRISKNGLFEFLRGNDLEVFDKVAEEIKYKNTRVAFRDYCRIVHLFLTDNGIEEMVNKRLFAVPIKCRKQLIDADSGKSEKINHIGITSNYEKIVLKINNSEFVISGTPAINTLAIIEQFQNEIIRGLVKMIKLIRESNRNVGSQELYKKLSDKFSAYLVANQI